MASATFEALDRSSKKDLTRFVRVPWTIYAGDSCWVPPMISDEVTVLSPDGPFFEHADGRLFLATRGGEAVGRIAALHDAQALETEVGRIGFFECIDDVEVAAGLFRLAEQWLLERGLHKARGPISPNLVWSSPGVFVEGEPGMPNVFMPYTPTWYPRLWEACGYEKEVDTLALRVMMSSLPPNDNKALLESLVTTGYRFRPLSKKHLERDLAAYVRLRNAAYSQSTPFGFSNVTPREQEFIVKLFGPSLEEDLIIMVEKDGEVVGMSIGFLDLGPMLQALDGRIGPIRLIRALLAKRRIRRGRLADILTLPTQQNQKLMVVAGQLVIENMRKRGIDEIEGSWILETNAASLRSAAHVGMKPYRRYRIYQKALS
jgi:hypothetical protein